MKKLTKLEVRIWPMLKDALQFYPQSFSVSFTFIILAAITVIFCQMMSKLSLGRELEWFLLVITIFLSMYFWSAALLAVNQLLCTSSSSWRESFRLSFRLYPRTLCFIVVYLATYTLLSLWLRVLIHLGTIFPWVAKSQGIINLFLAGLPLLFLLLLLLLALPILLTEQVSIFRSFCLSVQWAWRSRLGAVFLMFIMIMIMMYLIMEKTYHAELLRQHNLDSVFNFLCLVAGSPLLINYFLLLTRRLRQAATRP